MCRWDYRHAWLHFCSSNRNEKITVNSTARPKSHFATRILVFLTKKSNWIQKQQQQETNSIRRIEYSGSIKRISLCFKCAIPSDIFTLTIGDDYFDSYDWEYRKVFISCSFVLCVWPCFNISAVIESGTSFDETYILLYIRTPARAYRLFFVFVIDNRWLVVVQT